MEKKLSIIQGLTSTDQANPIRITDTGEVKTELYALNSVTGKSTPVEIEPPTAGASLGQLKVALYGLDAQNSVWRQVTVDQNGQLLDGASNVARIDGGDPYSYGAEYSTFAAAIAGIATLRTQLIQQMQSNGALFIHNYQENVFGLGIKFYVTVSAWGA